MKKKILIIFILLSLLAVQAYAQSAKGTVAPFSTFQNTTPPQYMDTSGADKIVSFWDLPLWIIIACFIQAILACLIAIKLIPVIIGKIIKRQNTTNSKIIKKYVINNPGSTISKISRETKINRDTVKYYIQNFIASEKMIVERFSKFTKIFYKGSRYNEAEKTVISLLGNGMSGHIVQAITDNPGMTGARLASMFDIKRSSMHWYIERLLENKLIIFEQDGVHKRYFINPDMEILIRKYNKY